MGCGAPCPFPAAPPSGPARESVPTAGPRGAPAPPPPILLGGAPGPRSPLLRRRAQAGGCPGPGPRSPGPAPSPLTAGSPGGETFPGERRGSSGAPRPSREPGGGAWARRAPRARQRRHRAEAGGAAARPRPGRRPGQGSAWARARAPARAGAAAGPRRRGLFTQAAVSGCGGPGSSSSAAAAPLPRAAPPPRSRPPPSRRPCCPGPRSERERRPYGLPGRPPPPAPGSGGWEAGRARPRPRARLFGPRAPGRRGEDPRPG